jgi:hypothetical protein
MATYSDDFERAALGDDWTVVDGTPQIFGISDFGGASGASESDAGYVPEVDSENQYMECVLSVLPGNIPNSVILYIREDGSYNGYGFQVGSDGWLLLRLDAGTPTTIDSGVDTPSTGQTLRIEANGSTIRGLINGSEVGSTSDGTHTDGRIGILGVIGDTVRVESWGFGDLGGGATTTQEGYRWRLDDGDQANATWAAVQDTGITCPANSVRRLRVLVDTTGDVNSAQFQLEYKEANDANWTKVS